MVAVRPPGTVSIAIRSTSVRPIRGVATPIIVGSFGRTSSQPAAAAPGNPQRTTVTAPLRNRICWERMSRRNKARRPHERRGRSIDRIADGGDEDRLIRRKSTPADLVLHWTISAGASLRWDHWPRGIVSISHCTRMAWPCAGPRLWNAVEPGTIGRKTVQEVQPEPAE